MVRSILFQFLASYIPNFDVNISFLPCKRMYSEALNTKIWID